MSGMEFQAKALIWSQGQVSPEYVPINTWGLSHEDHVALNAHLIDFSAANFSSV